MKYTFLYRFRLLYHFFLSRSKFDIHSPFVYRLYSEVLRDKTDYAEYHAPIEKMSGRTARLSRKDCRLLFRLSRYFKPATIMIIGSTGRTLTSFLSSGAAPGCSITVLDNITLIDEPGMYDIVVVLDNLFVPDYFSRIMQHIHNDSVLIFCNIHGSKKMHDVWNKIKNQSFVTLTIDLFNLGLVFRKEELTKEDFILRY